MNWLFKEMTYFAYMYNKMLIDKSLEKNEEFRSPLELMSRQGMGLSDFYALHAAALADEAIGYNSIIIYPDSHPVSERFNLECHFPAKLYPDPNKGAFLFPLAGKYEIIIKTLKEEGLCFIEKEDVSASNDTFIYPYSMIKGQKLSDFENLICWFQDEGYSFQRNID
jgi:hypothetical protein